MKFDFFTEKTPPLVGIDISTSAVKMVKLGGDKRSGFKLEAYASSPLDKDAITDGNINDLDKVSDALNLTWKLLSSKVKHVALALPSSAVISKKVLLPAGLNDDEMEAQVESEANQYIPFSLDEVNLDYQIIEESKTNIDEAEVLIVAARKDKIEDRVAAAESASLKVDIMDVDAYATEAAFSLIANQLPNKGKKETIMMVDIGATATHINVIHNRESIYTRDQNFGGHQLTLDIQRRFGLTLEESETAKRQGGLPESYEPEVLQPFMQLVANEVTRAQQFFNTSSHENHKVDHIILAGGCAAIDGIDMLIEAQTNIHTIIADPFQNMLIEKQVKKQQLEKDAPSLLVACGLAMRGVTL